MKVRNLRADAVVVAPPGHPGYVAEPGEVIEVDDDIGKSLLEQPDRWAKPGAKTKSDSAAVEEE